MPLERSAPLHFDVRFEAGNASATVAEQPRRGAALWSAPRLGMGWVIPDSPLRVFGQLTAALPLQQDDYQRDLGIVHRAPAVVGRLAIGVDVRF